MEDKTDILFVSAQGYMCGAEKSLLSLLKHLRDKFQICLICSAEGPLKRLAAEAGVRVYQFDNRKFLGLKLLRWLSIVVSVFRCVVKTRPSLLCANNLNAMKIAVWPAMLTGTKLVWHSRDFCRYRFVEKFFSLFCSRIIAVSRSVKKWLESKGIDKDKIAVVYNGIETQPDIPTAKVNKSGKFTFVNVGQFVPWKRQEIFIRASEIVSQKLPNAQFVLAGDDICNRNTAYKKFLCQLIRNSAAANRFVLKGWMDDMSLIWAQADCIVHTAENEPFGRVIVEAMANRIPVIAANSGGPAELIQNNNNGLLFNNGDDDSLCEKMIAIAENSDFRSRIANAGFDFAMSNFKAEDTAEQIGKIYKQVLVS